MSKSRWLVALVATTLLVLTAACEKDPNDAQTWIDQLGDRSKLNEALHHLERLNDPRSIKPLGEAWRKSNKQSAILRAIINIAGHKDQSGNAQWADSLEFLKESVETYDKGSPRSVEDAQVACDALGRSGDKSVIDTLMKATQKKMAKLDIGNNVTVRCILALGKFKDPKVTDNLIKILESDPQNQNIHLYGAAALALAETGDPKALQALIKGMIFITAITPMVRPAIARIGKAAIPKLIELFQRKNDEVEQMAKAKDYDKKAPGNIVFKASAMLGDLRAKEAVGMLTDELKKEPKVAYTDEKTGAAGPSTHEAVLGALKTIADPSTAAAIRAYYLDPKTADERRPLAIDAYSFLAPDDVAVPDLMKYIKDDKDDVEISIRIAAAVAFGRIARTPEQAKDLDGLIATMETKSKTAHDKGAAGKTDDEKQKWAMEEQAASAVKDALNESKQRLSIVLDCKGDVACYAKTLPPTVKSFKQGEPAYPRAERALLEMSRMGDKANPQADALLKGVDTSDRFVRQGILLALPRVAPPPCPKCAERLQKVVESQSDTTTLDFLTSETKIVEYYYNAK